MKKILFWVMFCFSTVAFADEQADLGPQGLEVHVVRVYGGVRVNPLPGNRRPSLIGGLEAPAAGVSVPWARVAVLKGKQRAQGNFDKLLESDDLIGVAKADELGRVCFPLEAGEYTVVAEIDGRAFYQGIQGNGNWVTERVLTRKWKATAVMYPAAQPPR